MGPIALNKPRIFLLVAGLLTFLILWTGLPSGETVKSGLNSIPIPGIPQGPQLPPGKDPDSSWDFPDPDHTEEKKPENHPIPHAEHVDAPAPVASATFDLHPIAQLMEDADQSLRVYENSASQTFRQVVEKYRSKYGRHPPPQFKEWYKYARKRNVVNIDDFEHIMDDLRPFWSVEPSEIRAHAAHMWENEAHGAAGIHIRDHKIEKVNFGSWRSDTFGDVVKTFIEHLPDMDIAMNRLDQPRVVVPFEDLQEILQKEEKGRIMHPEAVDSFTSSQTRLLDVTIEDKALDNSTRVEGGWFNAAGKQYMDVVAKACPPESPARSNFSAAETDALYKEGTIGLVSNFNLSSDLCTVGPTVKDLHGMLYSASSMLPTHKLVPIFGECKVNVNNDILFPANMYYRHDDRYDYSSSDDLDWRSKDNNVIWRGVTSGGVQLATNWDRMHRQRLVQLTNGTWTAEHHKTYPVLTEQASEPSDSNITYAPFPHFDPSSFATQHSDIGFVESWGCVPNCSFYNDVFSWKNQTTLTSQFKSRYLIDVDGHSFSGRWHAFLQSKSLGLKATIFREWHDSRLFAWRHFVPVDNRYEELYALLTYFIGYDSSSPSSSSPTTTTDNNNDGLKIRAHDAAAQKIARQSREWSARVLRREDIEVYTFRLLLEYARISDDNRDRIGYSGDGSELDDFDNGQAASGWGFGKWPWASKGDGREE